MPVEVRELVIRAVATANREDKDEASDVGSSLQARESLDDKEAIINECIRQVLRILRKERER